MCGCPPARMFLSWRREANRPGGRRSLGPLGTARLVFCGWETDYILALLQWSPSFSYYLILSNFKSCFSRPQSQLTDRAGIQVSGTVLGAAVFCGHISLAPPPCCCFCPWCDSSSMEGPGPCPTAREPSERTCHVELDHHPQVSKESAVWRVGFILHLGSQAASLYPWCPALAQRGGRWSGEAGGRLSKSRGNGRS